jgi:hypothetical protein
LVGPRTTVTAAEDRNADAWDEVAEDLVADISGNRRAREKQKSRLA